MGNSILAFLSRLCKSRFLVCAAISIGASYAIPASGQTVGTCTDFTVSLLDGNNVSAPLRNDGHFVSTGEGVYHVGGAVVMRALGLWVGGLTDTEEMRFAGAIYGPGEYWPGPLDENGDPPNDCSVHNRIYVVSQSDIDSYNNDGTTTNDLMEWPVELGAEVVDGDGIVGNYDLAAGDRPAMPGDEVAFWVMNDVGNVKTWSESPPIGLEVQVTAFSRSEASPFDNTVYYKTRIIHKGNESLSNAHVGLSIVGGLVNYWDDFVGADTLLQTGYIYEGGLPNYLIQEPAVGWTILESPDAVTDQLDNDYDGSIDEEGEQYGMSSLLNYTDDDSNQGLPSGGSLEPFYYLQGLYQDASPIQVGQTRETTKYSLTGDPVKLAFWSEELATIDPPSRNTPGARQFIMGSGPFDFQPSDTTQFTFAVVWSQSDHRLSSITQLREDIKVIRSDFVGETYTPVVYEPPAQPLLISPPNGVTNIGLRPTLVWDAGQDSVLYSIELSRNSGLESPFLRHETYDRSIYMELPAGETVYWRVTAINGTESSTSSIRSFSTQAEQPDEGFGLFEVVANAGGPLPVPKPGAADFQGFPVSGRADSTQQIGDGIWFITTGDVGTGASYNTVFIPRAIRNGWGPVVPWDWEIRFSSRCFGPWRDSIVNNDPFATPANGCYGYDRFGIFGDDRPQLVPFELWNIGADTPNDASDDYRVVPALIDWEADGFDLQYFDASLSSGDDDPETDQFYWYNPCNIACDADETVPGETGYNRWQADVLAGTSATSHGSEIMARFVVVNWNGGSIAAASDKEDYLANIVNQDMPEEGTVFRISSVKPPRLQLATSLSAQHGIGSFTSSASGSINLEAVEGADVEVTGSFDNLEGTFVSAELYRGTLADPIELLTTLEGTVQTGGTDGTITGTTDALVRADLGEDDGLFVRIITAANPEGEILGQLRPLTNVAPGSVALSYPEADTTVNVQGAASQILNARWEGAGDGNADLLVNSWQLATDESFTDIIFSQAVGVEQAADVSYGAISDMLMQEGYQVSQSAELFHRAVVSDGSLISTTSASPITFNLGVVVGVEQAILPEEFDIVGNYPNPSRNVTSILVDVPVASQVEVEVYDILGRRVHRLRQNLQPGFGQPVRLETSSMASGVYVYRINARSGGNKWIGSDSMVIVR